MALALVLALAAWMARLVVTDVDQDQQLRQAQARAGNLALVFEEQIYRQVLSIDQTLRSSSRTGSATRGNSTSLGLQRRAGAMSDLVSQVLLIDARGRVIASTRRDAGRTRCLGRRFFAAHRAATALGR